MTNEEAEAAVGVALRAGMTWVDTASIYKNEEGVGRAINAYMASGGCRADVTVVSKISPYEMKSPRNAALKILDRLALDYVDVLLLHWPAAAKVSPAAPEQRSHRHSAWRELMRLKAEGKVKRIGVSNFTSGHLEAMLREPDLEKPEFNQVELHVRFNQFSLRQFCAQQSILIMAYSPLGSGTLIADPEVTTIAAKYEVPTWQALLAFACHNAAVTFVKSTQHDRIRAAAAFGKDDTDWTSLLADFLSAFANSQEKFCWCPEKVLP
ncbi:MAG: uncharacterized protein KVP18_003516 [Porospora cf. gigantea A]|uniref:uncharacterized protein n=1 Tax=Porospora cf. gigantea A TaxID=2853593 RepID=UPI003559E07F|nr:MAG: hypothetical protein KVP18_003516 [Porospora cf. gigantea A]